MARNPLLYSIFHLKIFPLKLLRQTDNAIVRIFYNCLPFCAKTGLLSIFWDKSRTE